LTKIDGGLSDLFRKNLPGFHFQRIETGGTGRGIPDTNYALTGGITGWIEYKWTDGWAVTLMPEQIGWLMRRARMGCRGWIAVRKQTPEGPRRGRAVDLLYMVPGEWAALAADHGLRRLEAFLRPDGSGMGPWRWGGGPANWDWAAVRGLLIK
jgi:hypothetical protein